MPKIGVEIVLSDRQLKEIKLLYKQGFNRADIVNKLQISEWSVRKAIKKFGDTRGARLAKFHKRTTVPITDEQKQCILGTLLGDGSLSYREISKAYEYQLSHCQAQKNYIEHIALLLGTNCNEYLKNENSYSAGKIYYKLSYHNKYELEKLAKLTIVNGKKKISKKWLSQLTPLAIAYWFMDDGSSTYLKNTPSVMVRFATLSFPEDEVKLLQRKLSQFGIKTTLQNHTDGHQKQIYIRQESINKFMDMIEPLLVERKLIQMLYKIKRRSDE